MKCPYVNAIGSPKRYWIKALLSMILGVRTIGMRTFLKSYEMMPGSESDGLELKVCLRLRRSGPAMEE